MSESTELADAIASEAPPVSDHAVAAEAADEQAKRNEWAELRDKHGDPFDPKRHQTLRDGSPRLSQSGKLCLKPGKRERASAAPPSEPPISRSTLPPMGAGAQPESAPASSEAAQAARVTVGTICGLCTMALGPAWNPRPEESSSMEQAWTAYYVEKGTPNVPPELLILGVSIAYVTPRLEDAETRRRAREIGIRLRLVKPRVEDGAHADSGDHGKRKDEPRKAARK